MTLKVINNSNVKELKGITSQGMWGDIDRLVKENIIDPGVELDDIFVMYVTKNSEISYIGQTLKPCCPLQMLGILETIKFSLLDGFGDQDGYN